MKEKIKYWKAWILGYIMTRTASKIIKHAGYKGEEADEKGIKFYDLFQDFIFDLYS